ncbi:hypothetical protein [Streptomyces abikoensis]|uniref:Uncharacterized protein n=1 Tax=Streptomyces abikoensis TaxID=97398 RepID=A0ABW7TAE4_9ACTN
MTDDRTADLWDSTTWFIQELFPSGWGNVDQSESRTSALTRMTTLQERNVGTRYRLVRRTTTETVDSDGPDQALR